jgi:hypothetical protein
MSDERRAFDEKAGEWFDTQKYGALADALAESAEPLVALRSLTQLLSDLCVTVAGHRVAAHMEQRLREQEDPPMPFWAADVGFKEQLNRYMRERELRPMAVAPPRPCGTCKHEGVPLSSAPCSECCDRWESNL